LKFYGTTFLGVIWGELENGSWNFNSHFFRLRFEKFLLFEEFYNGENLV
jgi:hypothetical protein